MNIQYFTDKVFYLKACGYNALEVLYGLQAGSVYSHYAVIPFEMNGVIVSDEKGGRVITDYEELKEGGTMKSKPVVMDHFSTVHTSYVLDFKFTNNITILTVSSATGKTDSFSFIKECMAVNQNIVCFNYLNYQKDIKKLIGEETGKLIVIDNADILLDDKNQYLSIGRNPKQLFATSDNLFELVSEKNGEQTEL